MSWQAPPSAPQIRHWYWYVIGAEPLQVPGFAVTVLPASAAPLIVGSELLLGATAERVPTALATPARTSAANTAVASTRRRRDCRSFIVSPFGRSFRPAWTLSRPAGVRPNEGLTKY